MLVASTLPASTPIFHPVLHLPASCNYQGMAMVHWRETLPSRGGVENVAQMPCSTVVFSGSTVIGNSQPGKDIFHVGV